MVLRRLAAAAFGLVVACVAGEMLFRLVPFERLKYEARYGHFSGNVVGDFLEYDPVLTFRNRPGARFPDAHVSINSDGLRGPEISRRKLPGVRRVLCLGDSCTFGGAHPYPEILQEVLDRHHDAGRFEVLNGGVIGYTSLHGLEWLRRDLVTLEPDVVTLYFGWNDLWRGKDSAIRDWFRRRVRNEEPFVRSYLWEAISRTATYIQNRLDPGGVPIQLPPERYRAVLEQLAALGEKHGFTPVLVTAPSGFRNESTPRWLIDAGFVAPGDSVPELRREYNEIVRQVAKERRLPLADCASAFEDFDGRTLFDRPEEDPIHPNDRGYRVIAEVLAETIVALSASPSRTARVSR
jgi:lysophospholipase L1-like esterase